MIPVETAAVKALEEIHQMMGVVESFELLRTGVPLDDVIRRTGTPRAALARLGAIIETKKGKAKVNTNFDAASMLERLRQDYIEAMEADIEASFVQIEKASQTQLLSIAAEKEKIKPAKGLNILIRPTTSPDDLFTPFSGGAFPLLERERPRQGMTLEPDDPAFPSVPPRKTQGPQLRRMHEREMDRIQHRLRLKVEERSREVATKLPTEVKPMLKKGFRPKRARPLTDAWFQAGHLQLVLEGDPRITLERSSQAVAEGLRTELITSTATDRFRSAHPGLKPADITWLSEGHGDGSVSPEPAALVKHVGDALDRHRLVVLDGLELLISIHGDNKVVTLLQELAGVVGRGRGVLLTHLPRDRLEREHWDHLGSIGQIIVEDAAPSSVPQPAADVSPEAVKELEKALRDIGVRRMSVMPSGPRSFRIAYNPDDLYFLTLNDIQFELKNRFDDTVFELTEDSSL